MTDESTQQQDVTRRGFERSAELSRRPDEYSQRWAAIHERIAEAAVLRACRS